MARKHQEPEPEPVLRDLPEPKEEPFVEQLPITPEQAFLASTSEVPPLPAVVFEGRETKVILLFQDRGGRTAEQSFHITVTRGPGKPEVRVIGASNVTIG